MPSNALPPLFNNNADDQGAPVVVLGYIGASITILVAAIRFSLTLAKKQPFRSDDYFFYGGAALAFITSVLLERAVDEGLGRHANTLKIGQLNAYTRLYYAFTLLSIFAQAGAKISVAFLFERIAPRQDKRGITILLCAISVWIVFAIFGTAFACGGKIHWGAECGAGSWLAFPILVTDMGTDVMLSFWMVPRIWKLQANMQHRIVPILLMSSRFLVVVAEAGLIGYLGHLRAFKGLNPADATWNAATPETIYICIVHLSVITATIPRINSFISDMQTKNAGLALTRRDYENFKSGSKSGGGSNNHSGNRNSKNWSRSRSPATALQDSFRPDYQVKRTNKVSVRDGSSDATDTIEMDVRDELETSSQSSLKANAVYQKTEFTWHEEYTKPSASRRPDWQRDDFK
ncbi:hypothetical protein B0A55_09545 [Friedmanniomyces simplex]|uniref:Rhodopsin domain-containing protein n=1 Tax=Friedmanniomyces simplex TaxID=329884 RepID=A0A4U0WMB1_9PEZI|nr:hypothetical protein B0A55_09545 [Friedmanniomyces simplex]